MTEPSVRPSEQYDTLAQEQAAANLGMWLFLATEVLFIGAMFAGYTVERVQQPQAFDIGSHHNAFLWGTVNTGVLLTSSLTMALAVVFARVGSRRSALLLTATAALGGLFLGIKFYEYYLHWQHGLVPGLKFDYSGAHAEGVEMFMWLYYVMTGVHALHLLVGIVIVAYIAWMAWRGDFRRGYFAPVEVTGLYWHFVDVVWVFLYPLLYLV